MVHFIISIPTLLFLIVLVLKDLFPTLIKIKDNRINKQLILVTSAWFILPFLYIMVTHPKLYNNCRQFLFITPPLFIFSVLLVGSLLFYQNKNHVMCNIHCNTSLRNKQNIRHHISVLNLIIAPMRKLASHQCSMRIFVLANFSKTAIRKL